eukprot:TRINITY_DN2775_c0_g1_i2.p1 TRINITY_DN2775_c0_g1~~TRINITY_DN2775_c0_g1_i2.p1  ORF type:complete len:825 (+),score=155.38 TRINITY_DN2775_c0_g1_i2:226-2700(+)
MEPFELGGARPDEGWLDSVLWDTSSALVPGTDTGQHKQGGIQNGALENDWGVTLNEALVDLWPESTPTAEAHAPPRAQSLPASPSATDLGLSLTHSHSHDDLFGSDLHDQVAMTRSEPSSPGSQSDPNFSPTRTRARAKSVNYGPILMYRPTLRPGSKEAPEPLLQPEASAPISIRVPCAQPSQTTSQPGVVVYMQPMSAPANSAGFALARSNSTPKTSIGIMSTSTNNNNNNATRSPDNHRRRLSAPTVTPEGFHFSTDLLAPTSALSSISISSPSPLPELSPATSQQPQQPPQQYSSNISPQQGLGMMPQMQPVLVPLTVLPGTQQQGTHFTGIGGPRRYQQQGEQGDMEGPPAVAQPTQPSQGVYSNGGGRGMNTSQPLNGSQNIPIRTASAPHQQVVPESECWKVVTHHTQNLMRYASKGTSGLLHPREVEDSVEIVKQIMGLMIMIASVRGAVKQEQEKSDVEGSPYKQPIPQHPPTSPTQQQQAGVLSSPNRPQMQTVVKQPQPQPPQPQPRGVVRGVSPWFAPFPTMSPMLVQTQRQEPRLVAHAPYEVYQNMPTVSSNAPYYFTMEVPRNLPPGTLYAVPNPSLSDSKDLPPQEGDAGEYNISGEAPDDARAAALYPPRAYYAGPLTKYTVLRNDEDTHQWGESSVATTTHTSSNTTNTSTSTHAPSNNPHHHHHQKLSDEKRGRGGHHSHSHGSNNYKSENASSSHAHEPAKRKSKPRIYTTSGILLTPLSRKKRGRSSTTITMEVLAASVGRSTQQDPSVPPPPPGVLSCRLCRATTTPEWRKGPDGAKTLCNACGLQYAKLLRGERSKRDLPT